MRKILGLAAFTYKIYIFILFCLSALLFYPILNFYTTRPKYHPKAFKVFAIWSFLYRVLVLWGINKKGHKNIGEGPYIIVANHASYADIFIFPSLFHQHPHIFLGKSEILYYPLIKTFFKNYNIPVFRDDRMKAARSLISARKKIQEGWNIIIFPEGGIPDHPQPKMAPFKSGAFKLAKECNVPILPITFQNNFKLLSEPLDILGSAHPGCSSVYFHPIITTEEINLKSAEELALYTFSIINQKLIENNN